MKKNELTTKNTKGTKNKAYPKYKPSGVEWLGEVPEHWEIKKFNYVIGFQEGPGIMAIDFLDDGVPLLRIRNIQGNNVDLDDCNFLDPFKVVEKWNHFRCKKNDLYYSNFGFKRHKFCLNFTISNFSTINVRNSPIYLSV